MKIRVTVAEDVVPRVFTMEVSPKVVEELRYLMSEPDDDMIMWDEVKDVLRRAAPAAGVSNPDRWALRDYPVSSVEIAGGW